MEQLFEQWAKEPCLKKVKMSADGSNRIYYRLEGATKKCVAAINRDVRENEAFFYFAQELRQNGINVPEVYAVSDDKTCYLQQDLGNETVYTYLSSRRSSGIDVNHTMRLLYRRAIDQLILMQTRCRSLDFDHAYPRADFDRQALQWDFNYFKYYFLRLFHIPFDEQLLERDFQTFIDYLLKGDTKYFMYRDFQSRNIMILNDELYFIDFQGARRGALQYDLASLLYSAKSDVPQFLREELLNYYIAQFESQYRTPSGRKKRFDKQAFVQTFHGYVLARMMQAMGAYGFRGVIEKKDQFVKSIPLAVNNLRTILATLDLPIEIPHLMSVWQAIAEMQEFSDNKEQLTVSVFSFSYKKGLPFDKSGNGGGFVFDCRALPNPGRIEEYKTLTGRDEAVIAFFEEHREEMEAFLSHVKALVASTIENYQERKFTRLMINFGCTGGRHRSVFCAEQIAKFIRQNYDCNVVLHHLEQNKVQ